MNGIEIVRVEAGECRELALMVGELLDEIVRRSAVEPFDYRPEEAEARARDLIANGQYWGFMARDRASGSAAGMVSLYESYALYAGGAFGTIPELYVRPGWRSRKIGSMLLGTAVGFAETRHWRRLEVTTPPLPEFDRTLSFYQSNGFRIAGGRKLKLETR